ncbi:ABC transporter substrate-binding protein [Siccirubricoccus sp. G192]|uniref:ABC transporter substrate-binding protein n=1 Tax=Siccirubricoccus sp. G192 TaxID=2849651 RepID=UPI001C2B9D38|nr:ABC transporter substrate-binding protein [Siccirubricoccus sp. G192]MBV1797341.1 ABC transporter substrate-binding protein [Siccirubricoccus sp. G192]
MPGTIRNTTLIGTLAAALALPAAAMAQTLTIGNAAVVTTIDPHYHNLGPNNATGMHIFSRLVERDARARARPALAESYRALSETVWEFKLRRDVKWHDGRDFTADDVVFTFERVPAVPNSPGGFGGFLRSIARVEVLDPHTIRLHTHRPHPLLPLDLASVSIIARHAAEGAGTEDYNSGKAAIGTGPYRLSAYRSGDRVELARNEAYWGEREPWERVDIRFLLNDGARTAALLAGDVDLIEQIPTSDLSRLRRDPRLAVTEIASLRTTFISPDYSRTGATPLVTDNAGTPLPQNPFRDLRVRRALSMAINRDALVERVMEGAATATAQWLPPGAFGHNPEVRPMPFDPDGAKRLLAEAGFPEGFRLTLASPNDRWPNDGRISQAVAQMWTRIGVRTQVDAMPFAAFVPRRSRQEHAIQLGAWGSSTGEASNYLVSIVATYDRQKLTGASNMTRHSDPKLDEMLARAAATMDDEMREAQWRELVVYYAEQMPMLQLLQYVNTWAHRRDLRHDPRMDERTVAMGVRPAAPGSGAAR